jgi:hypothetical protein
VLEAAVEQPTKDGKGGSLAASNYTIKKRIKLLKEGAERHKGERGTSWIALVGRRIDSGICALPWGVI